ncbi:di-trans,poly-cis-decaprenylcistransferase [candidate division WOR-3 bacterium]|nr:di-trans,poly-cis-decaprenylcistransferase [candidate division WOR-3 bacterium]
MAEPPLKVPRHVAAIMDGNGRWARQRGLPRALGHREGVKALHDVVKASSDLGIGFLTVYSFSTENWHRPESEVNALMQLMAASIDAEQDGLMKNNVRVKTIGRTADLPESVRLRLARLVDATAGNTGLVFTLALSYGGRAELVDACRRAVESGSPPATENDFARLLYDPELPDPDLLIRTGGEQRISNYLLWQLAYTELYFTETLWPDFRRDGLVAAVEDYGRRQRRFGRV